MGNSYTNNLSIILVYYIIQIFCIKIQSDLGLHKSIEIKKANQISPIRLVLVNNLRF